MSPTKAKAIDRPCNVYLFVPNLIGYSRVLLLAIATCYALDDYRVFVVCYSLSQILDAFDGMAARALGQSSNFGAVLDMVTDRVSTNILLVILGSMYENKYVKWFAFLAALDYASHWARMYSSMLTRKTSHKLTLSTTPWILRIYYNSKPMLFFSCFCQEAFLLSAYVWKFVPQSNKDWSVSDLVFKFAMINAPLMIIKQIINLVQLVDSCNTIVASEKKSNSKSESRSGSSSTPRKRKNL